MFDELVVPQRQIAPSAKRCIKTQKNWLSEYWLFGQKAQSAKRCIKTRARLALAVWTVYLSESTERQKVH